MDPTKTLEEILECVKEINEKDGYPNEYVGVAMSLADRVEELNNWIASGGCLPEQWQKNKKEEK